MIADRMENIARYAGILPHAMDITRLWRAGALAVPQAEGLPFEVRDKRYATKPDAARRFEVHARTIDLMIGLEGEEIIHICPQEALRPGRALEGGADGMKMEGPVQGSAVVLRPGCFVAIAPGEAHMVGGMAGDVPEPLHKLVVKLAVQDACPCPKEVCKRHGICAECVAWHRNPNNSLPYCLRAKGNILIQRALEKRGERGG